MSVQSKSNTVLLTLATTFTNSIGLFLAAMGAQQPSWYYLINSFIQFDTALQPIAAGLIQQDDSNPTTINIAAGRFSIQGTPLIYAGGTLSLAAANNATSYVWIWNNSGTVTISQALSGTGWPSYPHIKLGEVTLLAGIITTILDRRGEAALSDAPAIAAATATVAGTVKMAAVVAANADSVASTPTQADVQSIQTTLNNVIAALKTAGIMHS